MALLCSVCWGLQRCNCEPVQVSHLHGAAHCKVSATDMQQVSCGTAERDSCCNFLQVRALHRAGAQASKYLD